MRVCRYPQCHQVSTFTRMRAVISSAFSTHYPQSTRRAVRMCSASRSRVRDVTRTRAGVTDITLRGMPRGAESHFLRSIMQALATEKVEKVDCCGSIRTLGLFQTTGETCAKSGSNRFRNVDLYKVQTNKVFPYNQAPAWLSVNTVSVVLCL